MSEQATAWVTLIPSAKGFGSQTERALDGQLPQVGTRQGQKLGSRMAGGIGGALRSVVPPGLLAIATVGGLAAAGVGAAKAFEEAESVGRKLTNVLGNMGKAGAAPELERLARTLQRQTGIDDEVIKGGETMLATFKNVASSAGVVGGTFDRATRAAVDMSSVFGSVQSASRVLGKALEDPVKGVALLRRANVTLTESQQEQIKAFVKTGETAKAQDVILQELNKRFGGSAVAAGGTISGQLTRLKNIWSDFMENVGFRVANVLRPMLDHLLKWVDSMGGVWGIFDKLNTAFNEMISLLTTGFTQDESTGIFGLKPDSPFIIALKTAHDVGVAMFNALKDAIDFLMPSFERLWAVIQVELMPSLIKLWNEVIKPLLPGLGVALVAAIWVLINAITIAVSFISLIINVFIALGHIVADTTSDIAVWFYLLPGKIADGLKGLWSAITKPFSDAFNWVKNEANKLKDTVAGALNPLQRHSPSLVDLLNKGVPEIPKIYGKAFDQINGMAAGLRPTLIGATAGVTPGGNVTTNIYGNINNGSNADRDAFFRRLTRNQELAAKGMATKPGSVG